MSKRYEPPPKEFGRNTKKIKYDIIMNDRKVNLPITTNIYNSPNSLFDDADDDVILLATQAAESQQDHISDLTFSEFVNIQSATSTQKPNTTCLDRLQVSQMLDDNDDDAFFNLEMPIDNLFKIPTAPVAQQKQQQQQQQQQQKYVTNSEPTNSSLQQIKLAERRQLAAEQQAKIFHERMSAMKDENKKLFNDLECMKNSVVNKTGEAALLRDELRNLKHQVEKLKMDKLMCTETAKSECKSKIDELSRTIETRETQLQLKSAECAILKMRQLNDSMRIDTSIICQKQHEQQHTVEEIVPQITTTTTTTTTTNETENTIVEQIESQITTTTTTTNETENTIVEQIVPQITTTKTNEIEHSNESIQKLAEKCLLQFSYNHNTHILASHKILAHNSALKMHANLYVPAVECSVLVDKHRSLVQIELCQLQLFLAQLMYNNDINELSVNDNIQDVLPVESIKEKILTSACKVFYDFWTYVENLGYPKDMECLPSIKYDFNRDHLTVTRSLLQPTELFVKENVISLRRYVAALSLACAQIPELSKALLQQEYDNKLLLNIISDAIYRLGYSTELNDHNGLLEAFACFLHMLIIQLPNDDDENIDLTIIVELFKQLVFARPSPWVFCELAACLFESTISLPNFINAGLCINSPIETFKLCRVYSVYRFTQDSCILQV